MSSVKISKEPAFYDLRSLAEYLQTFLSNNPDAVQLDGSTTKKSNPSATVYFFFDRSKKFFQLNGDTTCQSIVGFLFHFKSSGNECLDYIPPTETKTRGSLRLRGSKKPNGWYCYEYEGFLLPEKKVLSPGCPSIGLLGQGPMSFGLQNPFDVPGELLELWE